MNDTRRARPVRTMPGDLSQLRREIDAVDRTILEKLNERARLVQQVGDHKRARGAPIYSAGRERDLVARLVGENAGPFPDAGLRSVFREIISATRSLEAELRVAYLGPQGTYCHLATRGQFGDQAQLCEVPTIADVFGAIETGAADLGVVPVENTIEGIVTQTVDVLVDSEVTLCGEVVLPISHHLLSQSGRIEDVRRVASHPQPLAQCRRWLERQLPSAERLETASTSAAAQLAVEQPDVAAIASSISGTCYGLATIASGIEDRRGNTTRFLLIGPEDHGPPPTGNDLTSAVFSVRKDEAGALLHLLEPFARSGVSLTAIQSRPMKGRAWEYLFFLDCEGHRHDPDVARALEEASRSAYWSKVLGSFPRAPALASARGEAP